MLVSLSFVLIEKLDNYKEIQIFFSQILEKQAKKYTLNLKCIKNTQKEILAILEGEEEKIINFSQNLSNHIPLSLQWTFKDFQIVQDLENFENLNTTNTQILQFLTPFESSKISDKKSEDFCNLWGDFTSFSQSKLTFLKDNKRVVITNAKGLQNALFYLADLLKNQQSIFIKTIYGKKELILFDEKNKLDGKMEFYFMPFDLNNTQSLFKTKQEDLQALATLEKPLINLTCKSIFIDFFNKDEIPCILPYEPILLLLSKFLEDFSGCYLLPLSDEKIQNGMCYYIPQDSKTLTISVAKNGLILPHRFKNIQNFALQEFQKTIKEENLEKVNALYLGKEKTLFYLYFNQAFKEAISFNFECNLALFIEYLQNENQTTQSLFKNFTQENKELINTLQAQEKITQKSNNLLDLLGLCGILLGFSYHLQEAQLLLMKEAKKFMGEKGPRIDFRLKKDSDNSLFLDTFQTLRSVMSFKLAGVEKDLLCFGILDSLAEFLANFSRDMEENYTTKGLILSGSAILNKQFINQLIHYLPKNSEMYVTEYCDTEE